MTRIPCPKCDLKFANEYVLKLHRQHSCCGIRHDCKQERALVNHIENKQREIDAKIAESYYFGSSRNNGTPFEIAEAIRLGEPWKKGSF